MPENYNSHERAALFVLMMENRDVPNPELTNDYGIELRQPGRDRLNKAGLLVSRKEGRRFVHRITGKGSDWCVEELAGIEPPPRTGPEVRVVFHLLRCFTSGLRQRGIRLLDVIRPGDLESVIREAYQELSVKPQDWVRLAKLRPKLNGADKDEVDEVLLKMIKTGTVHLAPSSDRKSLTDDDRTAAIRIGDQDKHLVAIEES
jgi:hypothetical protein